MKDAEIPDGFKMTEIGDLPEEWEIAKLGDVADYINGYAFKPSDWGKKGLPIIRIQNLTNSSNLINYFDGELNPRYRVKIGDLLISWSATLGVYLWQKGDAWLNQHIFKVANLKPNTSKSYLFYRVMESIDSIKLKTRGSTMKHITRKEFSAITIPLPPLPEQKKIAFILSTIQQTIEKTEAVINATKELKKSLMKHLFTYGPVSVEEAEDVVLKETEVGLVPEEWKWVRSNTVCTKIQDGSHFSPKIQFDSPGEGRFLYVTSKNIKELGIDLSDITYVDHTFHEKIYGRCNPEKEDVLLIKDGVMTGIATVNNLLVP